MTTGGIQELKLGIVQSDVVACSYHFFRKQVETVATWFRDFDRIWLDEGHLALSKRRQAIVRRVMECGVPIVGLTFCGDYNEEKSLNRANALFLRESCAGHPVIGFVAGIKQAEQQANALEELGVRV